MKEFSKQEQLDNCKLALKLWRKRVKPEQCRRSDLPNTKQTVWGTIIHAVILAGMAYMLFSSFARHYGGDNVEAHANSSAAVEDVR